MGGGALKVLIANETYPPQVNGAAIATHRLVRGLAQRGHQVCVVAPNTAYRDEEQNEPSIQGVKIYRIRSISTRPIHPEFRVILWTGIDAKLERIFRQFKPDIVHIQNQFVMGRGCLKQGRKFGIPVVGTNHFMAENLLHYFPKPLRQASLTFMWKHCLRVYNQLDCVIAPSYACLKVLREAGLTAQARVISNGIDLKRYSRVPSPNYTYRNYGISPNVPIFIAVGRLEKDKRVDLIIRAAALAAAYSKLQLVVVGRGKDKSQFRQLAKRLGLEKTVVFTGYVPEDDLKRLYSIADVYVGAGAAELQGLAVMEAMAMGLPVLAANSVALPELVKDGDNGFLFQPTVKDLADKMRLMLLLQKRWNQMGKNSLARIQAHDMPVVLDQLEELYRRLVSTQERKVGRRRVRNKTA